MNSVWAYLTNVTNMNEKMMFRKTVTSIVNIGVNEVIGSGLSFSSENFSISE